MINKSLGATGITISQVGLGTWQFSGNTWGIKDEPECIQAVSAALENGINYFDTALEYGNGRSESLLGKALKNVENIVISTKVPPKCDEWSPKVQRPIEEFFPKEWIIECCEKSLKNLKRDSIDILFLHTWNAAWAHCTDWFETMEILKKEGKIKAIGISVSDHRASEANVHIEGGRPDVIQVVYNLFAQEPAYTLFPLCKKHQVGVIARCPLSSGALSGIWTKDTSFDQNDWRSKWTQPGWLNDQLNMVSLLRPISEKIGLTLPQLAMLFALEHTAVTSVIFGSTNPQHIAINTSVSGSDHLSGDILNEIKELWIEGKTQSVYNGG